MLSMPRMSSWPASPNAMEVHGTSDSVVQRVPKGWVRLRPDV
jgi:hypothetical protein